MDLAVFGQNLTNKEYFDNGYNVSAPGFDFSQLFLGSTPRTFGVELVKSF
jgi:outer membrane receptor protein involved in Fe transport